ncbi:hypothetical protein [Sulfurimonas sp. HSL-1716]|uniref:CiaD-like domain-containing protein n=1 Tax=Hydrocurvibacter sulfurireducens TaxID=3131937 RepID=UPI0031F78BA7
MELKDVILSTLAELDDIETAAAPAESKIEAPNNKPKQFGTSDEKLYLQSIQERLLVLFEGFQSPNNSNIEAKVDLTLNFLEYLLASIENRISLIDNKEKK